MKALMVTAGSALLAALSVSARANMFLNGALDIPDNPALYTQFPTYSIVEITPQKHTHALAGWTVGGSAIDVVTKETWGNNPAEDCVDLAGTTGLGSISQTVTGLAPGNTYQLSFDLSANPVYAKHGEKVLPKWLDVAITGATTKHFYFKETTGAQTVSDMEWVYRAIDFSADAGTETFSFTAFCPAAFPKHFGDGTAFESGSLYAGPVVANLNLDTGGAGTPAPIPTAPEPASLGFLLLTGVLILRRSR